MSTAYLGLGSNIGDKAATLAESVARLAVTPGIRITARSSDYRTPPWGDTDQDWFLNAAVAVDTTWAPRIVEAGLAIETALVVFASAAGGRASSISTSCSTKAPLSTTRGSCCRIGSCGREPSCSCRSPRSPRT